MNISKEASVDFTNLQAKGVMGPIREPKMIDYEYIRLRTQQLLTNIDTSSLSSDDMRKISLCMEDIATNELSR